MLVRGPRLVILDEATSALDLPNEALLYEALAAIPDVTYLSVGHRPSLLRFHDARLRLLGVSQKPSYTLDAIAADAPDADGERV